MGLPRRHHVVVYLLAKSNKTFAELNAELNLDENEVDAAAWLDENIVQRICDSDAYGQTIKTPRQFFEYIALIYHLLTVINSSLNDIQSKLSLREVGLQLLIIFHCHVF